MVVVNDTPTLVHSLSTPLAALSFVLSVLFPGRLPLYTRAEDLSEGTRRTGVRLNNVI